MKIVATIFGTLRISVFVSSSPLPFRRFGPVLNDPDDLPVSIFRDLIPTLTLLTHEGPPRAPLSSYQTTRSPHTPHTIPQNRAAPHTLYLCLFFHSHFYVVQINGSQLSKGVHSIVRSREKGVLDLGWISY